MSALWHVVGVLVLGFLETLSSMKIGVSEGEG